MIYVRPNQKKSWQINLPLIKTFSTLNIIEKTESKPSIHFLKLISNVFISELSDSENSVHILQFIYCGILIAK